MRLFFLHYLGGNHRLKGQTGNYKSSLSRMKANPSESYLNGILIWLRTMQIIMHFAIMFHTFQTLFEGTFSSPWGRALIVFGRAQFVPNKRPPFNSGIIRITIRILDLSPERNLKFNYSCCNPE